MSSNLAGQFSSIPIFNQLVPNEGPRSIAVEVNFGNVDEYLFDGFPTKEANRIQGIQSMYFDNSYMDEDVILSDDVTGQVMVIPGRTQGYRNILINDNLQFTLTSQGNNIFAMMALNVPMFPHEWSATINN